MYSTLNRYVSKRILHSYISILIVLTCAIWLSYSLRFLDFVIDLDYGIRAFFKLNIYMLPNFIVMLSPLAITIAVVSTYQKLISDHEITIMRSVGVSNIKLFLPIGIIATLITLANLGISHFISPTAHQQFTIFKQSLKQEITSKLARPGAFTVFNSTSLYIDRKKRNTIEGIFIHTRENLTNEKRNTQNTTILYAEKGQILRNNGQVNLLLKNGIKQTIDASSELQSSLKFTELSIDLQKLINTFPPARRISSLNFDELVSPPLNLSKKLKDRYKTEFHSRFIIPLQIFLNAVIMAAVLLRTEISRRQKKSKMVYGLGLCLISSLWTYTFIINTKTNNLILELGYFTNFILMLASLYLLKRPQPVKKAIHS